MDNKVSLVISGNKFINYESFTVSRSLDNMCGEFNISSGFDWFQLNRTWEVLSTDSVVIKLNDQPYMVGLVDKIEPAFNPNGRSIGISGREKTSILVDSHVIPDNVDKSFTSISGLVAALNIENDFDILTQIDVIDSNVIRKIDANYGDTYFDILQKHCKKVGARLTTGFRGLLVITDNLEDSSVRRTLSEKDNVISGSVKYDTTARYSEYHIYSVQQQSFTSSDTAASSKGFAEDSFPSFFRTFVGISESPANVAECNQIAQYEKNIRSAKSEVLSVEVTGWELTPGRGDFWAPGQVVNVDIPSIQVTGEWVVVTTQISYSDGTGEVTKIDLEKKGARSANPFAQKELVNSSWLDT